MNVQALVTDLQNPGLVARALAIVADQLHVGKKLHFYGHCAVTLAGLTASSRNVEREVARGIAAAIRFGRAGEQVSDQVESFDVSHRIRSRRATYRRLIHQ